MRLNKVVANLNNLLGSSPLTVYEKEDDFSLAKVCTSIIYSGRVLLVVNNQNDLAVQRAEKILTEKNFKVTRYLFEGKSDNLNELCKMFNACEDARLVITLNSELITPTLYFATVNKIPAVICVKDIKGLKALNYKNYLKNGTMLDEFIFTPSRHVLIDQQILSSKGFLSEAFAEIESKTLALIDYRLKDKATKSGINLTAYSTIRNSILDCFSIFKYSKKAQYQILLENLFKIYIADFFAKGEVFTRNSIESALLILEGNKNIGARLVAQKIILGLLEIMFSGEHENMLNVPDYLTRSKLLATKTHIDELEFYNHFIKTNSILDNISRTEYKKFYQEVCSLKSSTDRMINIFIALGGTQNIEKGELAKAIKYAGDLPYGINSVTFIRESGILEFI